MAFDRDATLKQGEKFLRQGRLDAAIAEYARVVDEHPRDLSTANLLGDLYVRASQADKALEQYRRIADHLAREGFHPKASALYRKILKLQPDDEQTQLVLAEICAKQGQLEDAKHYLNAVGQRRRERGDRDGAADVALRLSGLDPADVPTRLAAARTLEEMGWVADAAGHFRAIYDDLRGQGRAPEALDALRDAVRLNPNDRDGRTVLARTAVEAGDVLGAKPYLDRETAGSDPILLTALVEIELRTGDRQVARVLTADLLSTDPESRHRILDVAWGLCATDYEGAYLCVDAVVDTEVAAGRFSDAASHLQTFGERRPHHVPSLLRLVEVCVDGDLAAPLHLAQERLADAYLAVRQATEARVIAEDLLAHDPASKEHADRLRRALVMLDIPDPDAYIAERLANQPEFFGALELSDLDELGAPAPTPAPAAAVASAPETVEPLAAAPVPEPVAVERLEDVVATIVAETPVLEPARAVKARGKGGRGRAAAEPSPVPEPVVAATAPAAADADDEVDLTAFLSSFTPASDDDAPAATAAGDGADSGTSVDFDSVFSEIETGDAAPMDDEFASQYMKLAKTYVDMGMVDEAMTALQTPVKAPRYRFEAASLLGRLHMKRGDAPHAIEWLERAADVPAPTVQEGRALLYDLGVTLDGAGETPRALAVFLELQSDAGDYRDVPTRIDRLARVQSGG